MMVYQYSLERVEVKLVTDWLLTQYVRLEWQSHRLTGQQVGGVEAGMRHLSPPENECNRNVQDVENLLASVRVTIGITSEFTTLIVHVIFYFVDKTSFKFP